MKNYYLILLFLFFCSSSQGQNVPAGFKYQTSIWNSSGGVLIDQPASLRFTFRSASPTGPLLWQEDHFQTTDSFSLFRTVIGTGASTGSGSVSNFSAIDWSAAPVYLEVSVDINGGTAFTNLGVSLLFSVPYAFYSENSAEIQSAYLNNLADVDTNLLQAGRLLRYNGSNWFPSVDDHSDTVLFAFFTMNAEEADTADFAYSSSSVDSASFAFFTDTSNFSSNSSYSDYAASGLYSDTTLYALNIQGIWLKSGNSNVGSSGYLGTADTQDLVIKTNNQSRLIVTNSESVQVAGATGPQNLIVGAEDGFLLQGTTGAGLFNSLGAGTRLAYHSLNGSLRTGGVTGNQWDLSATGDYSFCSGFNTTAGDYSISSGAECFSGDYTIAIGRKCRALATGAYPGGTGVALGDSSVASSQRCVAIGLGNLTSGATSVAIGKWNRAQVGVATALGTRCIANGLYSTVLGYYGSASSKSGVFLFADASSTAVTNAGVNNQFVVRASGGIVFYSDPAQTMGLVLSPGAGSWSMVSDERKKENFHDINPEKILKGIKGLKIKSWNYKSQSKAIRHIGPMAQDFYKTFHLGESRFYISEQDMDGVILAGIQALQIRVKNLHDLESVDELKKEIRILEEDASMNERLDKLEAIIKN